VSDEKLPVSVAAGMKMKDLQVSMLLKTSHFNQLSARWECIFHSISVFQFILIPEQTDGRCCK
jgi:hypothetical protein